MSVTPLHVRVPVVVAVDLVTSFALQGRELAVVWLKWAEGCEEPSKTSREGLEGFDTAGTGNSDGVYQDVSLSTSLPRVLLGDVGVHVVVSI